MIKNETPNYDILLKEKEFEIRKYYDFYIVEYENPEDLNLKKGFSSLYKYISCDNKENIEISMTVPVIQKDVDHQKTMAFIVPAKFGENIPNPNSPHLKIRKFEEGLLASVQYSGVSSESKQIELKKKLEDWIQVKDYKVESEFMVARYNNPLMPAMLRRNEIWVRISQDRVESNSLSMAI